MSDVTRILSAIEQGDPHAAEQLLPLVYDELCKLAALKMSHEAPGQTLQATALVHEAYLRLIGPDQSQSCWDSRGHFFAAAAEAMRRILVDRAREKLSLTSEEVATVLGVSSRTADRLWVYGFKRCAQGARLLRRKTLTRMIHHGTHEKHGSKGTERGSVRILGR
jgi:DNA-directed RNA polymerase specialized sigma24 family protein